MIRKKIPDELVIRAPNGRYWDRRNENECKQLRRSTGRCPTYGNCDRCSGSGPVGMYCQVCKDPYYGYNVMYYDSQRYIIDAEWFSRFMGATHMDAFADRSTNDTLRGRSTASTSLSDVQLSLRLERKYKEMIRRDKQLFQEGMMNDTNGDWDKFENEVHILDMNGEMYAGKESIRKREQHHDNRSVLDEQSTDARRSDVTEKKKMKKEDVEG